jgi:hypothetical protein
MAHMTWDLRTQHNPYHGGRETRGYPPYGRVYVCVCVCVYVCVCVWWVGGAEGPSLPKSPPPAHVSCRPSGDNLVSGRGG